MAPRSRPVTPPITLSSTFAFASSAEMSAAVADGEDDLYSRLSNPTVRAVEAELAVAEGAERSLLVSSGMAAVHLALLAVCEGASELVVQREVYGGTDELLNALRWPAPVRRVGLHALHEPCLPGAVLYVETPTNPLVRLVDLAALRQAHPKATIVVDATFASPALLRPLEHGADLVLHSATKAIGGHHDVVAGVVSGSRELMARVWRWRKILGPTLDPDAAYRVWRGLQTLELRVARQSTSAATLARFLETHPAVARVWHPSLPSHPDHPLLATQGGLGGGVLSFELREPTRVEAVLDRLSTVSLAPSLGGLHTLITWPAGVTHANVAEARREEAGVPRGLLRLAVGLEDPDPICRDLDQALRGVLPGP